MRWMMLLFLLAGCTRANRPDLPREILRIDGSDEVLCVAFSPDDTWVAVGGRDNSIRICSMMTGAVLHTLEKHKGWVTSVHFSPDGSLLASGGGDEAVYVWKTDSWRAVRRLEPGGNRSYSTPVVFSPDGSIVSWGAGQTVYLRDAGTGEKVFEIRADEHNLTGFDFSPNGKMVATADGYANVHLFEAFTGRDRPLPAEMRGSSVMFSPARRILAAWGMERGIVLCRIDTGDLAWRIDENSMISCASISPDGERVAAGHPDGTLVVMDIKSGAKEMLLRPHKGAVNCVAWSSDGRRLVTGGRDGTVRVWQVD